MTGPSAPDKPVIGIVGGIGAGKSTVAAELAALGCAVIDADAIGHELLRNPRIRRRLRARWGEGVLLPDGKVNRGALGAMVFASPADLKALNRIMHPAIRRRIEAQIARLRRRRDVPAVVLDAAVLLEAGWDTFCTHAVFVRAPKTLRIRRVRSDRGWKSTTLAAREKTQIPLDKKAGKCDYHIDNSSGVSHLREQVRKIFREMVSPADCP
jgi:dephospho-CoA kinase